MKRSDTYVLSGNDCAGEIFLGKLLLKAAGLGVKGFVANQIEHLSPLELGAIILTNDISTLGDLGKKLYQMWTFSDSS